MVNKKKSREDHLFQEKLSLKNYSAMDDFLFLKLCKIEDFAMLENLRFSKYMGEKGNELQQRSFLKTLGIDIKGKITTTNTKMPPDKEKGKKTRLDSRIITECGKDINIEMQRKKTDDFLERLLVYACKRVIEPVAKGQNYKTIKKVITVAICGYSFLKSPKYHNIFYLRNNNIYINEKLIDNIEIHILEIEKF